MTSYLFASPAGATLVFPGGQTCTIANTGGDGVRFRSDPSKNGTVLTTIPEGAIALVTNGPKDADGVTWYQLQYAGQSGWVDADQSNRNPSPTGGAWRSAVPSLLWPVGRTNGYVLVVGFTALPSADEATPHNNETVTVRVARKQPGREVSDTACHPTPRF